jgi:arylsulfatase A-like enzyme
MTGRYPARSPVGLFEPLTPSKRDSAYGLTADVSTLPLLLKKNGYETALIGKWHLGFREAQSPNKNGFDYFFGFKAGAIDYFSHNNSSTRHDLFENDLPAYMQGYSTDIFEDKAVTFIRKKHSKPFFLSIQFNAPHWPWQGPTDAALPDTTRNLKAALPGSPKAFAAMMTALDNAVGRIVNAVDQAGLGSKTLIIFTSDNGGEVYSDNGSYMKGKFTLWEGGVRVPLIARWSGRIPTSTMSEQPVINMDLTATFLALSRTNADPAYPLDGMSLEKNFTETALKTDRIFFWRVAQRGNQQAVRDGDWKYLKDENGEYLFNLATDPFEKNNLKTSTPEVFERLKKKYSDWEKNVLAPIPL